MSNILVKFIGKEYSIPQDVLTYIDLLDFTDSIQKQLASTFVRKLRNEIAKDNIGLLGNEDLATEIEQQVGKFIAKLCDNGIFSRTINDYLKNNKGYQLYSDVNKAALEKMKSLLIQEMDAWQAGYENAVNKAESHVTGMGFSIWSSSFVNHAIYAAMEASTLTKQGKEAEAQYQKDMNDLRSRLNSQYGGEKSNYINNTYIPNMESALTVFAYLQTGMLMEITFPQYDVRFIAVNDGVDSANGVSDFSGIKNYFNDFYARDTSRKIRAVQRAKGERGERVGTTIPYGYMKDPNNPKQYIPDPKTAPIVKRIFEMYASGIGIVKICDRLSAEKILCPSVYAFRKSGNKSGNPDLSRPYHWAQNTVRKMLSNQEYVGDTVIFKTYSKSNKLKKRLKNDPENILIFKDTHEAIIDRKTFEMVQRHFAGRKRPDKQGEMDKYAGFLFCGECGKRLYLHRGKTVKPENNAFQCGEFQRRTTECTAHYIRESVLDAIVLHNLQTVTAFARDNPDEFYAMATQNGEEEAKKFYRNARIQKEQLEKRIQDLDNIIRCLYEDRVSGRITPERYDLMANGYEQEQAEKKRELQELAERISEVDMRDQCIQEFIRNAKQYIEIPKLTPELLRVFIRRIEVYEKFEKYSRTAGNPIRIHYAFRLPEQEGIPAIEVLTQPTAKTA